VFGFLKRLLTFFAETLRFARAYLEPRGRNRFQSSSPLSAIGSRARHYDNSWLRDIETAAFQVHRQGGKPSQHPLLLSCTIAK
jgi:hypothetical protein